MEKLLSEFRNGDYGTVVRINSKGRVRQRIFDMGITRGVKIAFVKVAPMGDPVEFKLRGYNLSLRNEEAQTVIMDCPFASHHDRRQARHDKRLARHEGRAGCRRCRRGGQENER